MSDAARALRAGVPADGAGVAASLPGGIVTARRGIMARVAAGEGRRNSANRGSSAVSD